MEQKGYSAVGVLIGSQVIGRMGLDAARELSHFGLTLEQLLGDERREGTCTGER